MDSVGEDAGLEKDRVCGLGGWGGDLDLLERRRVGSGFRVQDSGLKIQGLVFTGSGVRVQNLGCRFQGLMFRIGVWR